ncbi:MAG: hypothetical protein ABI594_21475 [Ginsengibacter sp.]
MYLKEITLQTKNVSVLYSFYSDILELPVKYIDQKQIAVTAGASKLIFEETDKDENPFYHFAFNIPSNKLDEALQWIQNKVELLWLKDYKSFVADFVNWHAKSIYFLDSAGNILELIARFDLHDENTEPFSSRQLRNVSEIGLVLDEEDFDKKAKDILDKYQLNYFPKQPPLPHFRAVGDEEGLFIIVPEGRNWFATEMSSGIFPLKILFSDNGDVMELEM